jgi:hypothetical protein
MTKFRDYYKEPTTIIIEKTTRDRLKYMMKKTENYDKLLNRLMDYI